MLFGIVSKYRKEKGFDITTDNSKPSIKENTVVINNLLPALKLFWRHKEFDGFQEPIDNNGKKELKIKGD